MSSTFTCMIYHVHVQLFYSVDALSLEPICWLLAFLTSQLFGL